MDSNFNQSDNEQSTYQQWLDRQTFSDNLTENPYYIPIPPPNVTGTLHMGHAFQHTLIDVLIRHQSMQKNATLWQMGTDHAGIATQMLIVNKLRSQGIDYKSLGKEAFLKMAHEWTDNSQHYITSQMKRLGVIPNWETTRFTMDKEYANSVQTAFIELYERGLIYRGKKLINWDPSLQTAISDLEVEHTEEKGFIYTIEYEAFTPDNKPYPLTIATTRPETMFGDSAIAINPTDERYTYLKNGYAIIPIINRKIPIIEDDYVDPEFVIVFLWENTNTVTS